MQKINVAVLGLGGMGKTHVEAALESPYVDKVYGFEPDEQLRNTRCGELGIIPAGYEEILQNKDIKLVTIASINEVHVKQASDALRAGKAVLCEKPMGMTLDEAEELIAVEKETGGFLQIGFELHYSKMYQTVKEWIKAGLIGKPVLSDLRYYCCEFHHKNSWRSHGTGSFLIGEKLSHYLDLQRWFFDSEINNVYSVSAPQVVSYFNHRDNHHITTTFANGEVATLNFIMYIAETYHADPLLDAVSKQVDDGHYLQCYITGTAGAIETDVFKRRIRRWKFYDGDEYPCIQSDIVENITFDHKDDLEFFHNTKGQNMHIMELVAKGLPPEVSASDAFKSMKLCFAAEKSEDCGRIIDFNTLEAL